MSSDRYESLCQRIDKMEDWKGAALCAACASKVSPIIARLGLPDTWRLVEECLRFVWGSFDRPAQKAQGTRLAEALQATPEWQCEDNSFMPFAVTETLDYVKLALLAVASPSSANENAKQAFDLLVGLASSYDFSAGKFPAHEAGKASEIRLQGSEEESQERLVKMLESAGSASSETLAALQEEANGVAELFRRVLPMVCYDHASS